MRKRFGFSMLAFTLSVVVLASSHAQQPGTNGVEISYSLRQQPLTLHEPVILTLMVTNTLSQAVIVDLGQDREGEFSFILTTPDGAVLQSTAQVHEGISMIGTVSISSGGTLSQDLLLNKRFQFSVPGTYELQGHMTRPILAESGASLGNDAGFRQPLDIVPRDVGRLKAVCNTLVDNIDGAATYADAAKAAQILSYVEDPVAVPFLSSVLAKGRLVENIAISGLERVANRDAVEALISTMGSQNHDTALLAQAALTRIHTNTRDQSLKELIEDALHASTVPRTY